jgi:hypothetical protein
MKRFLIPCMRPALRGLRLALLIVGWIIGQLCWAGYAAIAYGYWLCFFGPRLPTWLIVVITTAPVWYPVVGYFLLLLLAMPLILLDRGFQALEEAAWG